MPGISDPSSLAAIPLFDGLTSGELIRLNGLLHRASFPTGRSLMTAEQPGEVAYIIILSGTVKVHVEQANGGDVIRGIRGSGEILGEMSLLDNASRSATVETLEEAGLLWIGRLAFQACLKTRPALAYNLLGILARRLRLATVQIQVLATQDLYGRVAYQLLAFADAYGETRARVNQVLGFYKQRSYISVDQETHITVHNRPALAERCR